MKENRGVALIVAFIVITVLIIIGATFLSRSIYEKRAADKERDIAKARYIAEAGLERALFDLKQDYITDTIPPLSWADGDINGMAVDPLGGTIPYGTTTPDNQLGGGSYVVTLSNIGTDEATVSSTGTYEGVQKTIQVHTKITNMNPWNTVIFAGAGASGSAISGNVHIRGSVIILGLNLTHTDIAIALSGTASLGNNYEGMPADLSTRIPALPTVLFNGEEVESLNASLWVRRGRADLSGTATVGQEDASGNAFKETIDGIYIDVGWYDGSDSGGNGTYYDGFGGNKGPVNVYSDNGTTNKYAFGDELVFPDLAGPSEYDPAVSRKEWLTGNSLHISESVVNNISSTTPNFSYSSASGSISWNQATGTLTISGVVEITSAANPNEPGTLSIGNKTASVSYTGQGTIFANDVYVHGDLLSRGQFPTTDSLGMIAQNNIELATGQGDSQLKMIGAFYANNQIINAKQNEVAGTFVSNYFNMGQNVPKIYQVPTLKDFIPPGMPGRSSNFFLTTDNWQEL